MTKTVGTRAGALRSAMLGLALVAVAGCSSIYRNHGYVPSDEDLADVVVGIDTRDSVAETLGAPSSSGVLNESGYYYVSSRVRHFGIREPEVVERQLVAITFDQRGVVRNVERYGLEDGQAVNLSRRVTETSVKTQTFLRQLLGNLGRFDPSTVLE